MALWACCIGNQDGSAAQQCVICGDKVLLTMMWRFLTVMAKPWIGWDVFNNSTTGITSIHKVE